MWLPQKGGTILVVSGPAHDPDRYHLFVILTEPVGTPKQVLIVPVDKLVDGEYHDDSCLLEYQEHEFITTKSFINYKFSCLIEAEKLCKGVEEGKIKTREDVTNDVLERACFGLVTSPRTPYKCNNFYCNPPDD